MNLTYKKLFDFIYKMTPEQLNMNVSVYVNDMDEYLPLQHVTFVDYDDVLDKGHPLLIV